MIDEAHCISPGDTISRPDYLTIPLALREFGNPPILAVTATATPEMAEQIATALDRLELCGRACSVRIFSTKSFRPKTETTGSKR
ncbi:MAG: hypothetical protein R2845_09945 [Thermomicrobiales bacterium]